MINCFHCHTPTSNPKFCSRSCSASVSNKTPKRKKKQCYCSRCNIPIEYRRRLCDNCLAPDMTIEEIIYGKHNSSSFALIRSRARGVLKHLPQVCEECGYDKHVEVCHIKSIASFSLDTLVSVVNCKDNLRLLCPNCHWEFDNLK